MDASYHNQYIRYIKLWSYVVTFIVGLECGPPNITLHLKWSIEPSL